MTYQSTCPHCRHEDPAAGAFCAACGLALPTAIPTVPRVVSSNELAATGVGQVLQEEELRRQAKKAEIALLGVAVIQTVVGGVALFASAQKPGQSAMIALTFGSLTVAAIFWGLFSWSQSHPLPAAIVGLVVYGTLLGLSIVFSLTHFKQGMPGKSGLGVGWVDAVVIGALIRAIYAGTRYRRVFQQAQGSGAVLPAVGNDAGYGGYPLAR
jgi:uncharacterized membrane protein